MPIIRKSKPDSKTPPKPLSLAYTNIRGIRTNFSHVESFLSNSSPDIFALCETNLNPSISSKNLNVAGYLPLVREDSPTHMHGLGVYVRDNLPLARICTLEDPNESFMCFRLSLLHSTSYLFFLYRSPSSQSCSVIDAVSRRIDDALSLHPNADILVFGDFNVHHQEWLVYSNGIDFSGAEAYNFSISQSLTQIVDFPTRFPDRDDHNPHLLDLFLTSNPTICKPSVLSPLGNSDHAVVQIDISSNFKPAPEAPFHRTLYSYHRGDWDSFRDLLRDIPWQSVFDLQTDDCAKEIISWLQSGIEAFVPSRKYQVKPHSSPWFNPACATAIAHRNHYFHLYQCSKTDEDKHQFTIARNRCKRVIREAKSTYENKVHERLVSQKKGSRDFWRIYNSFSNCGKSSIPPLFNGPEVLTSSRDKAELFAKMFSENSTLDDSGRELPEFPLRTDSKLSSLDFSAKKVASIIASLDPSKATGPDGIPVIVLQKCSPELSPILSKLYKKCVSESCFPSCWKLASVIPAYKHSGERSDPRNYRPISLLSVISKVFECLISSPLVQHLDLHHLFSDSQYGFRAGRSTADVLTAISERVYRVLNICGEARAVALDISKAFDKVWHAGLIYKLKAYGISGHFLAIIKSFLSSRIIRVVLDGQTSVDYPINSGVPQGSILGPILFLIFINDLPDNILSQLAIYADDTTIYSCLGKTNDHFDKVELAAEVEVDLRTVAEWGEKWLVSFNATKTKLLSINRFKDPFLPPVMMNGVKLPENCNFRLLGMTFSNDFSWNTYIELIAKSAAMKVGSLFRYRNFLSPDSIMYLYKATIRPCMEYCCHIWAGASNSCLSLLDRIQRRITNLIGPNLSLRLHSLSHRRNVASLSLFYKYLHGHCSDDLKLLTPDIKTFNRVTRYSTKAHSMTVQVPSCNKHFYTTSFFPRTSGLWNSLPSSCFPTGYDLQRFKSNINRHLLISS